MPQADERVGIGDREPALEESIHGREECGVGAYPQRLAAQDIVAAARERQVPGLYPLYAGQGAGMIDDIAGAAAVVRSIVAQARDVMTFLDRRVQLHAG